MTLQTCAPLVSMGGTSGPVKRAQTGSEDPHRRERKFIYFTDAMKKVAKKGQALVEFHLL